MFLHNHLLNWEARIHPLRQLFWECTLRCNLRCRHCGSDCTASALAPDMPFEDFEKVLLRIRASYSQGNIYRDDFVDVWENRFGIFRDHTPFKTGPCQDCRWWKKCRGNGMHLRGENGELLLCNLAKLTEP